MEEGRSSLTRGTPKRWLWFAPQADGQPLPCDPTMACPAARWAGANEVKSIERRRLRLDLRGRHLILFDAAATVAAFTVSLALRFDAPSHDFVTYLTAYLWLIPLLLAARLGAFLGFRLYQRVWRYASIDELVAVILAVSGSSLVAYSILYAIIFTAPSGLVAALGFPRSVAITDTVLMVALAGAWRFGLRMTGVGRA